jgi:hypothetical protein
MIITNKFNLPPAIYNACSQVFDLTPDGTFRVSELTSPPQQYSLKRKHFKELTDDASSRLWALLGTSVHYVTEKHSPDGSLPEEKLSVEFQGSVIKGRVDLIHGEELHDYKVTSVWSYIFGDKPEWETQLNLYAWIANQKGQMITRLIVYAILRDWQTSKAHDADYPPIPFAEIEIPMWSRGKVEDWLSKKIYELQTDTPRPCTPEEMWERPSKYAVMKKGQKKAVKLFDNSEDATTMAYNTTNLYIETRPGSRIRCESYCIVKDFCPQYKHSLLSGKSLEVKDA